MSSYVLIYPSLSIYVHLLIACTYPSLPVIFHPNISISALTCLYPPLHVHICPYMSISGRNCPSLGLYFHLSHYVSISALTSRPPALNVYFQPDIRKYALIWPSLVSLCVHLCPYLSISPLSVYFNPYVSISSLTCPSLSWHVHVWSYLAQLLVLHVHLWSYVSISGLSITNLIYPSIPYVSSSH